MRLPATTSATPSAAERGRASREDARRIAAATGLLQMRARGNNDPYGWLPNCNATLVIVEGLLRVMTAAHCLVDFSPDQIAFAHPTDVTARLDTEYGFQPYGPGKPVVLLDRAVVAAHNIDLALFSVRADSHGAAQLTAARAIPFSDPDAMLDGGDVDRAGEAGTVGVSEAAVNPEGYGFVTRQVVTDRVYLGRIRDPYDGRLIDVWGENVADPHRDSCFYGGSGSSTVAAGGWVSGPLSFRNYVGKHPHWRDKDVPFESQRYWRRLAVTGLTLGNRRFLTFCVTTAVTTATIIGANRAFEQRRLPPVRRGV